MCSDDDVASRLARLRAKADQAIWTGTSWLSADEVAQKAPPGSEISATVLDRWEADRRIFSLERSGQKLYPLYAFDAGLRPLPAIHVVLDTLPTRSSLAAAIFFESTSRFLGGRRARELIGSDPELVIAHAKDEREWHDYGG
jgi:hypothetical protein